MQTCSVADRLLSLRALLPEAEFIGGDDIRPLRCTSDSRRVRPGDLFAALPGDRCDGHQFIAEAIQARRNVGAVRTPADHDRYGA